MANDLSAFNAQLWSKSLIANLDQLNVMLDKVNRQFEGQLEGVGDSVKVRTLGSVTTGTYAKGQTIQYQDITPTVETFQVNDSLYAAINVDDIDAVQNDIDALNAYTGRMAVEMNNQIEAKILSTYASAHSDNQITNGGSAIALDSTGSGTSVYDNLVLAREKLALKNVPSTMRRWCIVSPKITSLLLKDTTHFIRSTSLGDAVTMRGTVDGQGPRPGYVGMCAGFEIYESNVLPTNGSNKYLVYGTDMAIAYAAQLQTVEAIRRPDTFANSVRMLLLHDTKVFTETSKMLGYIYASTA